MSISSEYPVGDGEQAGSAALRHEDVAPCVRSAAARGETRLAAVEAEIAFQGDAQRELSDALAAQQVAILALQRQVRLLGEQLAGLRSDVAGAQADDGESEPPPPHY